MTEKESGETDGGMNLTKYLSSAGVAARRKCADIIKAGEITVNGTVVFEPGFRVSPTDKVERAGRAVGAETARYYIMLNKPAGYVCSSDDPFADRKAIDLINIPDARLFSAGRLDKDSEGLIIFTNDGAYAEKLTHPRNGVRKTYRVISDTTLTPAMIKTAKEGVEDEGETLRALDIRNGKNAGESYLVMGEGKKREVRRIMRALGAKVFRLTRVAVGGLRLQNLRPGEWRHMSRGEIHLTLKN
jgi:23S rRNA pseudouridine2605 synthase